MASTNAALCLAVLLAVASLMMVSANTIKQQSTVYHVNTAQTVFTFKVQTTSDLQHWSLATVCNRTCSLS